MPGAVERQLFGDAAQIGKFLKVAVILWLLMAGKSLPDREVTGWSVYLWTMELEIGSKGIFDGVLVFARFVKIHLSPSTPITTFAFESFATSQ